MASAASSSLKNAGKTDAERLVDRCHELETSLAELTAKYEQYFLGVDRRPPIDMHERLKKEINGLRTTTVKQTAAKFRVNTLNAKLVTLERLWSRTMQEIEAGTYKRDLFKAKLHQKEREAHSKKVETPPTSAAAAAATPQQPNAKVAAGQATAAGQAAAGQPGAAAAGASKDAAKPSSPPPAPRPSGAGPAGSPGGLSDAKLKAIYDAYVMAKKRCNEDTSRLSFESVSQTLKAQVPALMKQHNAKSVEFKVVIKDGKAVLRALPKSEP